MERLTKMTNVLDPEQPSRQSLLHFDSLSNSDPDLRRHDQRVIHCNNSKANATCNFKGNSISTTKYNLLTFLPKGLFEQFRRVANLYFLTISILSSTPVSSVHPVTNLLPLTLVLLVSLIKEAIEDWKRYKSDKIINSTMIEVLYEGRWVQKPWSNLAVGDIVKVMQDNYFPADLLFLASTNEDGICYIETSNLDGETNLKIGKALERTWDYIDAGIACNFFGEIECEQPNNSLYTFTGNLVMDKQLLPLSPGQILLRGCSLRNTKYIVGVTIFAGHETKVMMNAMDAPSKRSTLERRLDKVILILFGVLFVMCLIGALGSGTFIDYKIWYLGFTSDVQYQFNPNNKFSVASLNFFTFVTLFSTIIPISLYVSIEMIKFVQSTQFINRDENMYHSKSNVPALARTSNLNEELGQIEYIFSDKTGTLTQNVMEFLKCSIAGVMYGHGVTEADQSGTVLKPSNAIWEKGFNFDDVRLMKGSWRNELRPEICIEFFRCLAICHTVLPEGDETTGKIVYQAASPDESALVTAAKNFGFFFYRRTQTTIRVRESHVKEEDHVEDVEYQILNVLEFNSTRKRQSVICRYPTGRLVLYCKGADDAIYERLAKHGNPFKYTTMEHLERFGTDGLRSLCLAFRELDHSLYEAWNEKFVQAQTSLHDREKKLDEVAELIEVDLILIGCTAIEDKLQEGVPKCIETLSKAGIKIWVLTGDKVETAINIAYACSLMNNEMKQFIIKSDNKQENTNEMSHVIEKKVKTELELAYREAEEMIKLETGLDFALVIDGRCLTYALSPDICGTLLKLSMMCKSVLCCRVSPLQKAQVTKLIKDSAEKITLSVGDGANDVSMIQAAHIGVGISGQEGMQAVMASDFSIAQFRFLTDLLLVHGRWSYIRICKVVLYCFYKNFVFTLTQFWFNIYTGFSGQRFYDDWYQSLYNVLFTALPIIVLGIFEKDVNASVSKQYPQLYKAGIDNAFFKWREVLVWAVFAVYQSLVLFYFPVSSHKDGKNSQGRILGLWDAGTMAFTFLVITVNLRLLMSCNYVTRWHHISIGGSIIVWFLFSFLYGGVRMGQQENVFQVIYVITSTWYFWFLIILVPAVALLLDFLYQSLQRWFSPYDYQILQEVVQAEQLQPWGKLTGKGKVGALAHPTKQSSRNTGYAFDSPAYESFFASEHGVQPLLKPWDVACRHSMKVRCPTTSCTHQYKPPKSSL